MCYGTAFHVGWYMPCTMRALATAGAADFATTILGELLSQRILVADDDGRHWAHTLKLVLASSGPVDVEYALTPDACRQELRQSQFNLLLLDIQFGSGEIDGLRLLQEIRVTHPDVDVIMLTNCGDGPTIVRSRRLGAKDFVTKARNDIDEIALRIRAVLASRDQAADNLAEARRLAATLGIAYASPQMDKVFQLVLLARDARNIDVLIGGPLGVGKDLIASAIGRKAEGLPFVSLNCGAIPESLIESELFGHEKGAFTGADRQKVGKFEEASGGDIFLDEIGCLSITAQSRFLRALENREITRLGANRPISVDVRVIAATNADLDQMVREGKFRADLLSRLRGMAIAIPPLVERKADIAPIVKHYVEGVDANLQVHQDCMDVLSSYSWPENVRELKRRVIAMAEQAKRRGQTLVTPEHISDEFIEKLDLDRAKASALEPGKQPYYCHVSVPLNLEIEEAQRQFMRAFLVAKCSPLKKGSTQNQLARSLNLPRSTMLRRLQRLGLDRLWEDVQSGPDGHQPKAIYE